MNFSLKMDPKLALIFVVFIIGLKDSQCAKILGLFPHSAYSHHVQANAIFSALANKGHEITFLSPVKQKIDGPNIKYIHIENFGNNVDNKRFFDYESISTFTQAVEVNQMGIRITEFILQDSKVQNLIHSNATFDLIIMDMFLNEAFLGFGHRFNCSVILVSTFVTNIWTNHLFGNTAPVSYIPCFYLDYTSEMNFLQRLNNFIIILFEYVYRVFVILPRHNKILKNVFSNAPNLDELLYRNSLILINTHISINDPVPLMPNMIEVGGYHILKEYAKLPKDMQEYLDSSTEGVIYFSMGSNLKSKDISLETRNALMDAFGSLKQTVLWKFETHLVDYPSNVKIEKWFPQQAILDHPNTKAFISHGGLLSTIEAVYFGVPIIGIPIFADQKMNIEIAKKRGYAISVPMKDVSKHTMMKAIEEIISNSSYKTNIMRRSKIMKDRKLKPLDTAIYWIEYVLRYNGASHFQSVAMKLYWFQYYSIDTMVILFLSLYFSYWMLKKYRS